MKTYSIYDYPQNVFGVPFFAQRRIIERLPEEIRRRVPRLDFFGRRCIGARLAFRTDARSLTLRLKFATLSFDIGMSIYACQSANIMVGPRREARLAGLVCPQDYNHRECEKTVALPGTMTDVTIHLPRNEILADVEVVLDDDAAFLPPTPFAYEKPLLFYGSSITEGGCVSRLTNAYTAILSRWMDIDFYCLGFSGNAQGELEVADYINSIEKSAFIYDYDHNAPSADHLEKTHEPFFRRIREHDPQLPILMMSRPDFDGGPDCVRRRDIIRRTYENALAAGDQNVYFLDGSTYYDGMDRDLCTVDGCHPTDIGMYCMAKKVMPVLENALRSQKRDKI